MSTDNVSFDVDRMIQPDILLPEQYESSTDERPRGAAGLLWAVFADGIRAFCSAVVHGTTHSLDYREAERWIFRPDSEALTSFSNLCGLFDVEPRKLRRKLLQFREQGGSEEVAAALRNQTGINELMVESFDELPEVAEIEESKAA